jgi:hypothetical protein
LTRRPTVLNLSLKSQFPVLVLNVFIVAYTKKYDHCKLHHKLEHHSRVVNYASRVVIYTPRVVNYAPREHLYSIGITHDDRHMTVVICLKY